MPQELANILWGALGLIVTTFIGWLTTTGVIWLNNKIKDAQIAKWASMLYQIIMSAVQTVFQEYVDVMKKAGKWNEETAKEAKEKAMKIIISQITPELKKFIEDNFGDMKEYLMNQIEAMIYQLKR